VKIRGEKLKEEAYASSLFDVLEICSIASLISFSLLSRSFSLFSQAVSDIIIPTPVAIAPNPPIISPTFSGPLFLLLAADSPTSPAPIPATAAPINFSNFILFFFIS
jgi:hypothetical protein